MEMAGRGFHGDYRFGYQGSEKDNEISGDGNSYTTEFRQLDPRLGRWFSVDPWDYKYPFISPYASMFNNPICKNDPKGLGDETNVEVKNNNTNGSTTAVIDGSGFR
jgi:RHS repeat-associated protein